MVDQCLIHQAACVKMTKIGGIELDSNVVGKEPVNTC